MSFSTNDLPCWLSPADKEIAQALLQIDWIWLEHEEPENWANKAWEYKLSSHQGWQFWGVPGEVCLLVVRSGAVFGLCLEAQKLDFGTELQKAKTAIFRVKQAQDAVRPKQLALF